MRFTINNRESAVLDEHLRMFASKNIRQSLAERLNRFKIGAMAFSHFFVAHAVLKNINGFHRNILVWSRRQESNPRQADYRSAVLPLNYTGENWSG